MIVVTGKVEAAAEQRGELVEVARVMCEASRGDAGCLGYRFYEDTERAGHFVFLEEWEDDEALQSHFAQPHTSAFMSTLLQLISASDAMFHTVASTRVLGASGLEDI
jgi:quinol monooxygenase YgiN